MLKTRIVPCLLLRNHVLVKTVRFQRPRPIGTPMPAVKIFNLRNVDELLLLDIEPDRESRGPFLALIEDLLEECYMPLTVGGGVRSVQDFRDLLNVGADKVCVNTAAVEHPELLREAAETFGSQCVVVSIDARREPDGRYQVYTQGGRHPTGKDPAEWARKAEDHGAGEVFLTSIDREGTMSGYDHDLVRRVVDAVNIPVVAHGGAGKPEDFVAVIRKAGAAAAAASSIFQFTQATPGTIRADLRAAQVNVR